MAASRARLEVRHDTLRGVLERDPVRFVDVIHIADRGRSGIEDIVTRSTHDQVANVVIRIATPES